MIIAFRKWIFVIYNIIMYISGADTAAGGSPGGGRVKL